MGSTLTLGALGCSVSTNTNIEELHLYIPDSLSDYPYDCLHRKDKKENVPDLLFALNLFHRRILSPITGIKPV